MGDGEAFETFLWEEMPRICRVQNCNVAYRGRCTGWNAYCTSGSAASCSTRGGSRRTWASSPTRAQASRVAVDMETGGLLLSHGWIDGLVEAVVQAPENADQFGTPPNPPLPIHLPKTDMTVGGGQT